jgi:hypothetical protein
MTSKRSSKSVGELKYSDFIANPVWGWADEKDESLVEPVLCAGTLPAADEHDNLLVASTFRLGDGTEVAGAVAVRMTDSAVYLVSIALERDEFLDIPLQPELRAETVRSLSSTLGRPASAIFPIQFTTAFVFSDGQSLRGVLTASG